MTGFTQEKTKNLRIALSASPFWKRIAGMLICASPNHRKVMKAEHGRQIPLKLTADLEPSIFDDTKKKSLRTQLSRNV